MKTKKKGSFLLSFLLVVAVVVVGLFLTGRMLLAKVLETAIGAPVEIQKFNLNLFSSEVGIDGIKIKNPPGFQGPILASIPEIYLHVDVPAIFQNRIHIQEIRLNLDEITVERNSNGAINLLQLGAVKQPKKETTPPASEQPAPSSQEERPAQPAVKKLLPQFEIDTVRLSLGRAQYKDYTTVPPSSRTFSLEIQNSVLRNVTNPAQITQQIVVKTLQKIGMNALLSDFGLVGTGWEAQLSQTQENLKEMWGNWRKKF